ncbi:MAG: hypothetical protein WBV73_16040 [Phormidium sp.]
MACSLTTPKLCYGCLSFGKSTTATMLLEAQMYKQGHGLLFTTNIATLRIIRMVELGVIRQKNAANTEFGTVRNGFKWV